MHRGVTRLGMNISLGHEMGSMHCELTRYGINKSIMYCKATIWDSMYHKVKNGGSMYRGVTRWGSMNLEAMRWTACFVRQRDRQTVSQE